jgi:sulfur relay (sulfurtransferase) DsrC/TusE family protein
MLYEFTFYDRIEFSRKISQMIDLQKFVDTIFFANLMMNAHHDFSFFNDRIVLIMHNDTIKQLNDMILRSLQNEMHTLNVVDSIIDESRNDEMLAKFLSTLKTSSFLLSRLCLKIKAFVMFLRNLYFKQNLCNEIRLMITRISRRILKTRILSEELVKILKTVTMWIQIYTYNSADWSMILQSSFLFLYITSISWRFESHQVILWFHFFYYRDHLIWLISLSSIDFSSSIDFVNFRENHVILVIFELSYFRIVNDSLNFIRRTR